MNTLPRGDKPEGGGYCGHGGEFTPARFDLSKLQDRLSLVCPLITASVVGNEILPRMLASCNPVGAIR